MIDENNLFINLYDLGGGLELVQSDRDYVNSLIGKLEMMIKKSNDNKKKDEQMKDEQMKDEQMKDEQMKDEQMKDEQLELDFIKLETVSQVDGSKLLDKAGLSESDKNYYTELYNLLEDCDLIKGKDRDKLRQKLSERPTLKYKHIFNSRGEKEPTGRFVRSELSYSPAKPRDRVTEPEICEPELSELVSSMVKIGFIGEDRIGIQRAAILEMNRAAIDSLKKLVEDYNKNTSKLSGKTYTERLAIANQFNSQVKETVMKASEDGSLHTILEKKNDPNLSEKDRLMVDMSAELNWREKPIGMMERGLPPVDTDKFAEVVSTAETEVKIQELIAEGSPESIAEAIKLASGNAVEDEIYGLIEETVVFDTKDIREGNTNSLYKLLENSSVDPNSFFSECPCVKLLAPESGIVTFDTTHADAGMYRYRTRYSEEDRGRSEYGVTVRYRTCKKEPVKPVIFATPPEDKHPEGLTAKDLLPVQEAVIKDMIMARVKTAFAAFVEDISKDIAELLVK